VAMQFTKAEKQQAKARVAITGPAGAGKTYTALSVATSMCSKVAVIDTEHGSASKYADEFSFDVLELQDFHPNNYVEAIKAAQDAGYDGVVIDSASHEWFGKNGCLELVDVYAKRKGGNSYAAWADVTPLHTGFIESIHQARIHVFATFRSKMDYVQSEDRNGKKSYQKVGMAPVTRDGAEYEFDVVLDMDLEHTGMVSKSRCRALADKVFRNPGADVAQQLLSWLNSGAPAPAVAPPPAFTAPAANQPAAPLPVTDDEYTALTLASKTVGITTREAWLELWHSVMGNRPRATMTQDDLKHLEAALQRRADEQMQPETTPPDVPSVDAETPGEQQKARAAFFATCNENGVDSELAKEWLRNKWADDAKLPAPPETTKEVPVKYIKEMTRQLKSGKDTAQSVAVYVDSKRVPAA